MKKHASHQTADDILLALPKADELITLRKKVRRLKAPRLDDGAHWGNSKVGTYTVTKEGNDLQVTWKVVDGPERTASFESLGQDNEFEDQRLELGWMIANMLRIEAVRMLHAIPDPNEAMREADRYGREENRWRYWALNGAKN